ncbi:hypothetical protein CEUSTIGMA_g1120.t1 [Chlamydomonas eustigma]|uniref:Nucleoside phosphorylase domain-containing protein n=1 Tax=Chlamydomonas eustigma TaxID=1157962 RepID=A0A250WSI9_9CHLO|nr:hypothetical protein CEUSTIGMA_g1120.t1 [Chlamydomonas eustigma]|eukprot:GAX73669.1 hypothetical protein CEUSTIGMA_g1120.t1 [Chlamydomonas eustigma]
MGQQCPHAYVGGLLITLITFNFQLCCSSRNLNHASSKHRNSVVSEDSLARCQTYLGWDIMRPFSAILTADPGTFSGVSEAHFILANLVNRTDKAADETVCGLLSSGILLGETVLVVTTGIGPSAAAMCTLEVLTECGAWIQDAVYFGTSGWSPQPGGLVNPPNCTAANWKKSKITRTGDVCISPFCVNWTCKQSTWVKQSAGAPNQCMRPAETAGPVNTSLFGECMFYKDNILGNVAFADSLIEVSKSASGTRNFPSRPAAVSTHEELYWSRVAQGVGRADDMPKLNKHAAPRVWDYTQCMEVDGQLFFNGSPWELKARDYAAETLNAALKHMAAVELKVRGSSSASQKEHMLGGGLASWKQAKLNLPLGEVHEEQTTLEDLSKKAVTADSMIAVSAMEGVGVSEAFMRYHALSTTLSPIPFTHIRTLSNWMLQPIQQVSPGVWEASEEVPDDFVNGYAYAISTGSSTILSLFQARCLAREGTNGANGTGCSFEIVSEALSSLIMEKRLKTSNA